MAKKFAGRLFMLLFSLPFAAVSLGILLFSVIPHIYEWQQMKFWHQVEARLQHVQLVRKRGDKSYTYRTEARYSYIYEGREYQNDRAALMEAADNIGDFQQQLAARLEAAWRAGRPVTAWVNPKNPAEAVLNREMRWSMLGFKLVFILLFGIIGFGMLIWGLVSKPGQTNHPESAQKPWLGRRDWADNRIGCDTRISLRFIWIFALLWNLISSPAVFAIPGELARGKLTILAVLLFPLVGLLLVGWAVKATLAWRRFGQLVLVMDPFPGSIGGQVGGSIDLPLAYNGQYRFPVTLMCARSYVSGSGKNRSRKEASVWQAQGMAYAEPAIGGTRLKFCFSVPEGLPASEEVSNNYHLWRLSLSADLPGVDLHRQFVIPVYPTAEKSVQLMRLSTEHPEAVQEREALIESVLQLEQIPGGLALFSPMKLGLPGPLCGIVFGLIFGGVGVILVGKAPAIIPWVFIPIGFLALFFSLKTLFGSLRVQLDRQGMVSQRYWMGLPMGSDRVARSDIRRLIVDVGYEQQSTRGNLQMCNIKAETLTGRKIPVARNLKGRETAQQALEIISSLTGYPHY